LRELKERYGSWSLLAGAAEGLGEAWSVALAERGMNIIMVDHQDDLLQSLAARLEQEYGIQTIRHHLDLAEDGCVGRMLDSIRERSCRFIIYNAAFSKIPRRISTAISELTQEPPSSWYTVWFPCFLKTPRKERGLF
jgi:short-subunit dehydrogenase